MESRLSHILQDKGSVVHVISSDVSVYDCVKKMNELQIGALIIMQGDQVEGIVSERDIVRKLLACECDVNQYKVKDIMSRDCFTVPSSMTVTEAMRIITDKRFRHLPVVDNGKLVGMISIGDLTRWVMLAQENIISNLTKYIQGD